MEERDERARGPLALRCEAIAPWLWRVAVAGHCDAEPSEVEREEIEKVARSRESGALVVLHQEWGREQDGPLPAALAPLTGRAAPLALASLPPMIEFGAVDLFAPRGRGRVVALRGASGAAATDRPIGLLAGKEATARALAAVERALADFAERDGWRPLPARRRALDLGELRPAAAGASSFDHETAAGALFLEASGAGGDARPIAARLVRGSESFTLTLAEGGRPLAGRSLVLLRATAPADRGALLRVELDDEDLGPWRLGDAQESGRISFDLFRISSDLLAGRERVRLAFRLDDRPEIASLRWWFLTEEEPDGLWLTELEPAHASAADSSARGHAPFDRAADGLLLLHDDELFLRGIALAPGGELRFVLPHGERRLVMTIAPAMSRRRGEPAAAATLVVTTSETSARVAFPAGSSERREFAGVVRGGELVLKSVADAEAAGGRELLLLAPKLLR